MTMKRFTAAAFAAIMITTPCTSSLAQKPLSCEVQVLLNGLTAMQRDQGIKRSKTAVARNTDGDLSAQEIKEILDRVYIHQKTRSPDQIKDDVYHRCLNRGTGPSPSKDSIPAKTTSPTSAEDPKTIGLDCRTVGFRYGYTGMLALQGKKIDPAWDFETPARCRNNPETQIGIQAGSAAAK